MKKMLVLLLAFAMTISLVACGKETVTPTKTDVTASNETPNVSDKESIAENDVVSSQETYNTSSKISANGNASNNQQNTSSKVNPSTNTTSVVSQPNNVEKTENSPPESGEAPLVATKNFSTANELKSWMSNSKSQSEENGIYKEAITYINEIGVIVPTTSFKCNGVSLYTSKAYNVKGSVNYFYRQVHNEFNVVQTTVSIPNDVEKQYLSKGIVQYYTDVKKVAFDKETYGDEGEVISKTSKGVLQLSDNSYECVIADTDRGRESNRSYIFFLNGYKVHINFTYNGDIDTELSYSEITKQISLNLESLK